MNWKHIRAIPWVDTRARFVAGTPRDGRLLDIGSSDGETLGHIAELRPDLTLYATDLQGCPERYPEGCEFHRGDLQKDRLPWSDASLDAITCMHLVEHLSDHALLFEEVARLLKPGGRIYLETPHPRTMMLSSPPGSSAGTFTMNFFDDLTHIKPVTVGGMAQMARRAGLEVVAAGTSRNLLFAASYPFSLLWPNGRQKFTARVHWLGWSAYLVAERHG